MQLIGWLIASVRRWQWQHWRPPLGRVSEGWLSEQWRRGEASQS